MKLYQRREPAQIAQRVQVHCCVCMSLYLATLFNNLVIKAA